MISKAWLLSLLLAVPLVGYLVSAGVQAHLDSELRSAAHSEYPNASAAQLEGLNFNDLCEDSAMALGESCETNSNLRLMSGTAVYAGLVGVALLVLIGSAGVMARTNRLLLLLVFKPGLYLTVLTLVALILAHAALAMGAIYYGESALTNQIHVGVIAAIGLGAGVGALAMVRSAFSILKKAQTVVVGRTLQRSQAPLLWEVIEQTAAKLGALRPEHVVVGVDPNFFVTEADVICLDGKLTGRTLYCSLPLCRILTADELTAVIGHELGHFKGSDTKFSKRFYPIYRGSASSLSSLQAAGNGSSTLALLPAVAVLSYFLECFSVAESRLSRDRELAADNEAAAATSRDVIASALVKIHAFSGMWVKVEEAAVSALRDGTLFVNPSKLYADFVVEQAQPASLLGIDGTHVSHPTDSHPSLAIRLRALETNIEAVSHAALDVSPSEAAITLVADEAMEEEIGEAYQVLLARNLEISLDETPQTPVMTG